MHAAVRLPPSPTAPNVHLASRNEAAPPSRPTHAPNTAAPPRNPRTYFTLHAARAPTHDAGLDHGGVRLTNGVRRDKQHAVEAGQAHVAEVVRGGALGRAGPRQVPQERIGAKGVLHRGHPRLHRYRDASVVCVMVSCRARMTTHWVKVTAIQHRDISKQRVRAGAVRSPAPGPAPKSNAVRKAHPTA